MQTNNPVFNERTYYAEAQETDRRSVMTVSGTVAKTGILTAILLVSASFAWSACFPDGVGKGLSIQRNYALGFVLGGLIGGFVSGIVMLFKPKSSPIAAPFYAVCEGLVLGAISGLISGRFQGIVLQAGMLTVGVLAVMLIAYAAGLVRATEKFKMGVIAAAGAVGMVYLGTWILAMFGIAVPYIHSSGPIGIGFSVVVVVISALYLVLNFDMIEQFSRHGAPAYMEWYSGYGLLASLVTLYIDILILLMKIRAADGD